MVPEDRTGEATLGGSLWSLNQPFQSFAVLAIIAVFAFTVDTTPDSSGSLPGFNLISEAHAIVGTRRRSRRRGAAVGYAAGKSASKSQQQAAPPPPEETAPPASE